MTEPATEARDLACPRCGARPGSPCRRPGDGQTAILATAHRERIAAAGLPDRFDLQNRALSDLRERGGWWFGHQVGDHLGLGYTEKARLLGALVSLRRKGLVTSRSPESGKGTYGVRTVEWSAR